MSRKLTIAVSFLVLIAFSSMGQAFAQGQELGVHVGDNFAYSITSQWSSTDPSGVIPSSLVDANRTTAFNVTVSAIQNPNVTSTITWSFSNGTELTNVVTLDVD